MILKIKIKKNQLQMNKLFHLSLSRIQRKFNQIVKEEVCLRKKISLIISSLSPLKLKKVKKIKKLKNLKALKILQ